MSYSTDHVSSAALTRTLSREAPATAALRFLNLMVGGFDSEEMELTITIPTDWRDQEIQTFVFLNDAGRWMELEGRVERVGAQLKLTLPAGRLAHIAMALVPHYHL